MLPDIETHAFPVGHLPIVRHYLDELGILDVLDRHLPSHAQARVSDAECVTAMVLNILSGRCALYAMETWLRHTDTELLIGRGCEPDAFNDTRLALALDHLDAVGTDTLMGDLVQHYLAREDRPTEYTAHTDTTSFSLYGAYVAETVPNVTFGFSKDKRADLKQLIFGLTLHGSAGIPLLADVVSGNTSDPEVNRSVLSRLSAQLPDSDEVTVVADCKAVDSITVGRVLDEGLHLVSLVPDTYSIRGRLIDAAWEACPDLEEWPELERHPGRKKADPHKVYRGWSTVEPFRVARRAPDGADGLVQSSVDMRFLVVHSTTLAAAFDKKLSGKLEREENRLTSMIRKQLRRDYACEQDARDAVADLQKRAKLKFLQLDVSIESEEVRQKRPGPGRPPKGEEPTMQTVWRPKVATRPDEAAIEHARLRRSCFVLITDHADEETWNDQRILAEYRKQYIVENHTGFRWLKSEAAVSPMFLKTPTRIRAMGLVLVLALMVRNFIQFTLRNQMAARELTLLHPFAKKPETKLTTEMAMAWFMGVQSVQVSIDGGPWRRSAPKLQDTAQQIIDLLGVPETAFSTPPSRQRSVAGIFPPDTG